MEDEDIPLPDWASRNNPPSTLQSLHTSTVNRMRLGCMHRVAVQCEDCTYESNLELLQIGGDMPNDEAIELCDHGEDKKECEICENLRLRGIEEARADDTIVSVVDDSLDSMIQAASVPSLATLFKRGKEKGLLKATTGYAGGPP